MNFLKRRRAQDRATLDNRIAITYIGRTVQVTYSFIAVSSANIGMHDRHAITGPPGGKLPAEACHGRSRSRSRGESRRLGQGA